MLAKIIDGKAMSAKVREQLRSEVAALKNKSIVPGLAVILVGDDPASSIYVSRKKKACKEVGIESFEYLLPEATKEDELLALIGKLNSDAQVHGILVQLPLPKHMNEEKIIHAICPEKDVDGFHPQNVGKLMIGKPSFISCTPLGIMELLKLYDISVSGKECVVIGRSNIVGKPMGILLLGQSGTVTFCHSRTKDIKEHIKRADILVVAIGRPGFVVGDMIKPGAVVIDVGINRTEDNKVVGDVEFNSAKEVASFITPVPGGVGPMTIAMLLKNTVLSADKG